jgi:hypothetical protein
MNKKMQKAELAMLKVQERALELGILVSRPAVEGGRYDCILDDNGTLLRAQVKYAGVKASHSSGAVQVGLSKPPGRGAQRPYTDKEIDALLVYVPAIDRVCLFPPVVFSGRAQLIIRYEPPKNGRKQCLLAENYLW